MEFHSNDSIPMFSKKIRAQKHFFYDNTLDVNVDYRRITLFNIEIKVWLTALTADCIAQLPIHLSGVIWITIEINRNNAYMMYVVYKSKSDRNDNLIYRWNDWRNMSSLVSIMACFLFDASPL